MNSLLKMCLFQDLKSERSQWGEGWGGERLKNNIGVVPTIKLKHILK